MGSGERKQFSPLNIATKVFVRALKIYREDLCAHTLQHSYIYDQCDLPANSSSCEGPILLIYKLLRIIQVCYSSSMLPAMLDLQLLALTCVPEPIPPRSNIVWELGSCMSGKGCWAFPPKTSICHGVSSDRYKNLNKNILIMSQQRVSTFNVKCDTFNGSGISITFRGICPIISS